jgi:phosphate transport system substrate-binding protein
MSGTSTPATSPTPTTSSPPPGDSLSGAPPKRSRSSSMSMAAALGVAVLLLIVGLGAGYEINSLTRKTTSTGSSGSTTIALTETGSSLLYPLFKYYMFPNYTQPNVVLSAASTGSGTGQASAEQGLVNIGASDGYLANASTTSLINVPVAISAQLVFYNLPGVTGHLNLNGTVLAMIYDNNITTWDNPLIMSAQNSTIQGQISKLSSQTIYPVKRSDSSGDTFLFTSLCYMSLSTFPYAPSTSALSGFTGANVLSGDGNSGMVSTASKQTGSIAYIGISYEASAVSSGLQYAALGDNQSLSASGGTNAANYVLPSATTISQDANLGLQRLNVPSYGLSVSLILGGSYAGAVTLVHGGGGTNPTTASPTPYPDANLEYTLIKTGPTGNVVTSAALAATVAFLEWAITTGNYLSNGSPSVWISAVNFVPLTPAVIGYDELALSTVST